MSIFSDKELTEEEIDEMKENFIFSGKEIEVLFERFRYLDRSNSGYLTFAEFLMIPEFHGNPFSKLILTYLEENNQYEKINFPRFLEFLSIFSPKTDRSKRIEYLYTIFDLDKKGRLDRDVLMRISEMMCITPDVNDVEQALALYDSGKKGYLSISDFQRLYDDDESLEKNMIIDFSRNIKDQKKVSFWDIIWPTSKFE